MVKHERPGILSAKMYAQFFGFAKLPFRLRPDPEFLYAGHEYLSTRARLLVALRGNSRIAVLTGPPGVGKTLLVEDVLTEVAGHFTVCRINQPHISANELRQALLLQLRAPPDDTTGSSASEAAPTLDPAADLDPAAVLDSAVSTLSTVSSEPAASPDRGASSGRTALRAATASDPTGGRKPPPLLVVDDAQLMTDGTLRSLSELLARNPLLKTLLVAQSDPQRRGESLSARIMAPEIPRRVALAPLDAAATNSYVEHRLAVAGGRKELFTAEAFALIHQHTGGAARLINVMCDAALHSASVRAAGQVGAAEIHLVTQDSRWPEAVARNKAAQGAAAVTPIPGATLTTTLGATVIPAPGARLVVTRGNEQIATLPLEPGRVSIGRALDNELQLDASFISRHHCQVSTVGTVSTIEDLGSMNGIYVNGKLVNRQLLRHGDQIVLGKLVLTYVVN